MKTEQRYLVFWLSLFSFTCLYFLLIVLKFSRFSIQHLVRTCITGITSIVHFSADVFSFVIFPLAGLCILTIAMKVFFSYIKTQTKIHNLITHQMKLIPKKAQTLLSKHNIQQQEVIIVRSNQPLAYTIGIWSSKIMLSSALINKLSIPELEAVILHERHHQQHSHALLFFVGEIVNSILFLLPIFDDVFVFMKLKLETEADKTVIAYQKTTRHLLTSLQAITSSPIARYYPGFATYRLEDRVGLLSHGIPQTHPFSILKISFSLIVLLVSFTIIRMPVNADTSLNPQLGQKCEGSMICAETCPTVEKSTSPELRQESKTPNSSLSVPMSYGY